MYNCIEKFTYLRSLLNGQASQVINGLALTSSNYLHAIEMLTQRFGSKNKLVKAPVRDTLAMEPING